MKSLTEEAATATPSPQVSGPTEKDAAHISGLTARYIPFIPTPRALTDENAGHRCQLGFSEATKIVTSYDCGIPIQETVTYFHLRAFGRTWGDAIAAWRASKSK